MRNIKLSGKAKKEIRENEVPALNVNTVRGLLILRGSSVRAWSDRKGYRDAYVHLAIRGLRKGPKARRIVQELKEELGI